MGLGILVETVLSCFNHKKFKSYLMYYIILDMSEKIAGLVSFILSRITLKKKKVLNEGYDDGW